MHSEYLKPMNFILGLSTWALKTDSLDPDSQSEFNVVTRELHTARRLRALHCVTGSRALSRSTARSTDPDQGHVEAKWSLNPDHQSVLDADPRSRVESPIVMGDLSEDMTDLSSFECLFW